MNCKYGRQISVVAFARTWGGQREIRRCRNFLEGSEFLVHFVTLAWEIPDCIPDCHLIPTFSIFCYINKEKLWFENRVIETARRNSVSLRQRQNMGSATGRHRDARRATHRDIATTSRRATRDASGHRDDIATRPTHRDDTLLDFSNIFSHTATLHTFFKCITHFCPFIT